MAIIGFITCVVGMLWLTALAFMGLMCGAGPWNIGGAHNPPLKRIGIVLFAIAVGYMWTILFDHAPFTITFN